MSFKVRIMIRSITFFTVIGVAFLASGCGDSSGNNTSLPPVNQKYVGKPSTKTLPPEYGLIAESLALSMFANPDDFRENISIAESLAALHTAAITFRGIQSVDSDLNYIANLGHSAVTELINRTERLLALPRPPSSSEVLVSSMIAGLLSADPLSATMAGASIGDDATKKLEAFKSEANAASVAIEKLNSVHLMLPKIAEKFAATPSADTGRFQIDIDESWPGLHPCDWLHMINNGPDLDDCTVQVELKGSTGEVRKNVHFVRKWPANTILYTRYEPGMEIFGQNPTRRTVANIQSANVTVWSPQYTTSFSYAYQGAEIDEDYKRRCSKFNFTARYQPFGKGILWSTQRGCYFKISGPGQWPKSRAEVTFKKGAQAKVTYWDLDSWENGEERYFGTNDGELTFDPDVIEITLTFPNSGYKHKKIFDNNN